MLLTYFCTEGFRDQEEIEEAINDRSPLAAVSDDFLPAPGSAFLEISNTRKAARESRTSFITMKIQ